MKGWSEWTVSCRPIRGTWDAPRPCKCCISLAERTVVLPLPPDVSRAVGVSDLARRSATGLREDGAVSAHRARITRLMRAFRRMAAGLL